MQSLHHVFRRLWHLAGRLALLAILANCHDACLIRAVAQEVTPPGFRAYKLEHASAVDFGSHLRKMLEAAPGKPEVMVDKQLNRVLVQGNEEAHRLTAQLVKKLDLPAKGGEEPPPKKEKRAPRAEGGRHKLQNVTWREFEEEIRHVWGGRLAITASKTGDLSTIQLPGPPDAASVMQIDRKHGEVSLAGPLSVISPWEQVVRAIDAKRMFPGELTELVPIHRTDPSQVQQAIKLVQAAMRGAAGDAAATIQLKGSKGKPFGGGDVVSMIFQPRPRAEDEEPPPEEDPLPPPQRPIPDDAREGGLLGPVQIEFIEGLDTLVIRGNKRDVDKVLKIIEDIERESEKTKPQIEVYHLRHTSSQTISDMVLQLYDQVLSARQGRVSITPLIKPNALLLIGREESVKAVIDLIERLDRPVTAAAQFQVFQLKYMSALEAETITRNFFPGTDGGLSERILTVSEPRSNSIIVRAGPRDMADVKKLLKEIDVNTSPKQLEMRVFKLRNSLAQELAPLLQNAILGRMQQGVGGQGGLQQQLPGQTNPALGQGGNAQQLGTSTIMFFDLDKDGNKLLKSGILADVIVSADTRNNSLLVRAPAESMELIAALIKQLDGLPVAEAQIKVFTIVNADATNLMNMLQNLFGTGQTQGGGGGFQQGQNQFQSPTGSGESLLVSLRFAVDTRTNSIIASGSAGDLQVVEAVLLRLDEGDLQTRKTTVYRLNNAPAVDVANSINQLLTNRRQAVQLAGNIVSPYERSDREVIVVPEIVSNSLIVSATPKYFEEIAEVVQRLDSRPPMVMIQVVIAEVTLNDQKELGVELGLQDDLLFSRGLAAGPAAAPVVGFPFNQPNLGNDLTPGSQSLAQAGQLGSQMLSGLGVGRTNGTLGYGGLTLSAGNDSINFLLRALHDQQRLQVLSRPQVMTVNNQPAFIQVGQRVPFITGSTLGVTGTSNAVDFINVGILLGVTPRTSPDGLVVMEVNAEKSAVGPEADGIPISISTTGDVIRSPKIDITTAQTTVSAKSGQTVIFAGLITKGKTTVTRRTPYLSDIPFLGNLFRFDSNLDRRTELVIIMTPYVLRNEEDADWIKRMEADRMSWCLSDVVEIHQEGKGLSGNRGPWGTEATPMIYPDLDPTGMETVPANPANARPVPGEQHPELMPPDRSGSSRRRAPSAGSGAPNRLPDEGDVSAPAPTPASFRNAKQAPPPVPTADTTTKVWYGSPPNSSKKFISNTQVSTPADPRMVAPASFEEPPTNARRISSDNYPQPARFPEVE